VNLGTAASFAVIGGTTITNTGQSTITGDVGLSPGSSVTGFAPCTPPAPANCVAQTGALHVADAAALQAKSDQLIAYNDLVSRQSTCTMVNVELAGQTFLPGTYCSPGTFNLSAGGIVTLNANGDPAAEFIFLTGAGGSTLITGANSKVLVTNGAAACHVYFQVASSATIGVGTAFIGHILAATSIQVQTGATLQGSAFAQTGAVTLDTNTITNAACDAGPIVNTTTSTTAGPTTTTTTTAPATTTTTVPGGTTTTAPGGSAGAATTTGAAGAGGAATGGVGTKTGTLPRTGANLTGAFKVGVLALVLGSMMILASRHPKGASRLRR